MALGLRAAVVAGLGAVGLTGAAVGCGQQPALPPGQRPAAQGDAARRWAEPACAAAERSGRVPDPGAPGRDTVFVAAVGPGRPPVCIAAALPRGETAGAVGRTINGVVRVYRPGDRAAWQSFDLVESGYEPARLRDRDGDGLLDLEVLYFNGGPDTQYDYHLFDPRSDRFADAAIRPVNRPGISGGSHL